MVTELRQDLAKRGADAILSEIETRWRSERVKADQEADSQSRMSDMRHRLMEEVTALQRRGNLNLVFGGLVTAGALYVLWTTLSVQIDPAWKSDPWQLVTVFGPRLTLALFLQVFAYFFLKLYRTSLAEIKYFQNEMTNIEAKQLALITSMRSGNAEYVKEVVASLLATERNHILSKDQTTVELEKARLDTDQRSAMFKMFSEFWQKKG